jgi:hypothetical protein
MPLLPEPTLPHPPLPNPAALGQHVRDGLRGMRFLLRHGGGRIGERAAALPGGARLLDGLQAVAGHSPLGPLLRGAREAPLGLSPRLLSLLSQAPWEARFGAPLPALQERLLKQVLHHLGIGNAYVSARRMARAAEALRTHPPSPAAEATPLFWAAVARALVREAPLRDFDQPGAAAEWAPLLRQAPNETVMLVLGLVGALLEGGAEAEAALDSAARVVAARFTPWVALLVAEDAAPLAEAYRDVLPFLP